MLELLDFAVAIVALELGLRMVRTDLFPDRRVANLWVRRLVLHDLRLFAQIDLLPEFELGARIPMVHHPARRSAPGVRPSARQCRASGLGSPHHPVRSDTGRRPVLELHAERKT